MNTVNWQQDKLALILVLLQPKLEHVTCNLLLSFVHYALT